MTATIHAFPYRHANRQPQTAQRNAPSFTSKSEYRQRSIAHLIVLAFLVALTTGGLWIFAELTSVGRPDDCLQAHRRTCGALTLAR
jgi:hypothetical protein